ncbi:prepilin-type N-terminal cleavage/methylation domain-containing protein [Pontiellaceae bacterium B12227]|nr:prepilin-type N-terminal cleavage/methylation domain-containing protein [Pontiellaceae bacterium B12227]
MKKDGFTLIELLVVIVILGLLLTLGSKSLRTARLSAKKAKALVELTSIETAVNAYHHKYGKLPAADSQQGSSDLDGGSDQESQDTIMILTAEDTLLNPVEMVFLEGQGASTNGVFVDPWGVQYKVLLDTDYDGRVVTPLGEVRSKVAVYSEGYYLLNGSAQTDDYITSWQ